MLKTLIALFIFPLTLCGVVTVTNDVKPYLDQADHQCLVILDVADTLIEFKDVVLKKEYDQWKNTYYSKLLPTVTFEQTAKDIQVVEENPSNWQLVNSQWPEWIEQLKSRGVTVIGLTKTLVDPSLQNALSETLRFFGIVFSDPLVATSSLKGKAVASLVARFNPTSVIFIDDRLEQVESVDQALSDLNIPHHTIHTNTPHFAPPLNVERAQKQIETLAKDHVWLSDVSFE